MRSSSNSASTSPPTPTRVARVRRRLQRTHTRSRRTGFVSCARGCSASRAPSIRTFGQCRARRALKRTALRAAADGPAGPPGRTARPCRRSSPCPSPSVLLHAQLANLRTRERRDEVVLVEREAEMVHAGKLPLARLDDDVDRAALELRQPQLEPHAVEVVPAVARLEGRRVLADA